MLFVPIKKDEPLLFLDHRPAHDHVDCPLNEERWQSACRSAGVRHSSFDNVTERTGIIAGEHVLIVSALVAAAGETAGCKSGKTEMRCGRDAAPSIVNSAGFA